MSSQIPLAAEPARTPATAPFTVLLATDGSEQAFHAAALLAQILPPGSDVEVLTVLSMGLSTWTYMGELSDAEARRAEIKRETAEATDRTRRILEEAGHRVTVRRRFGNPPDETLAEVEETGPDLVVVGRRGLGRAASLVLGSVSNYLVRHSAVPVLVVP